MRILALYDSRYGFSRRCLEHLALALPGDVELVIRSILETDPFAEQPWDAIIVGGPIYHDHFRRQLRAFVAAHRDQWSRPRALHIFAVGLSSRATALEVIRNDLTKLFGTSEARSWFFGGRLPWPQLGWWARLTLKLTRGLENEVSNLDLSEIQALAAALGKL